MFVGGIKPHNYCLPILKREIDRQFLKAATGGYKFLEPIQHLISLKIKKVLVCAGVFNATYCLPILAQIFDDNNALEKLESFVSVNGATHYNIKINDTKIKLKKLPKPIEFKKSIKIDEEEIIIFNPEFCVFWIVEK